MAFEPQEGNYYRMPVFFGPTPGPRQWPGVEKSHEGNTHRRVIAGVSFLTHADAMAALLPHGFSLWGEPVVTVDVTYMSDLGWLAGRGYNMSDVKLPVVYESKKGPVHGTLVLVRWESLADPILSGREELGHNKLWCDIPPLRTIDGASSTALNWLGHTFMRLKVWDMQDAQPSAGDSRNAGILSYKYIPKTGHWGHAEAEYATLTPKPESGRIVVHKRGKGSMEYIRSAWEDLPTLYHVVNAVAGLEVVQWRGSFYTETIGGFGNAAETHILERAK